MRKVGIMGGTFNPIHYGHLFLAENALEQIGLDKILFMPTKNPPHKTIEGLISDKHRMEMVKLAIEGNPDFEISSMEYEREGIIYTADTLTILSGENPGIEYFFIVGADSLFMMQDWHTPQVIFRLSTILVAGRDRVQKNELEKQVEYLNETYGARIIPIEMPRIEISSSLVRRRISERKSIRYYVPDKVNNYITEHRLYGTIPEEMQ